MSNHELSELGQCALHYATEYGWKVFPCQPGGKIPATKHGCKDATTDPDQIKAWWTQSPEANIGLACGAESGVVAVDIDVGSDKDGWKSLDEFQQLPETVCQDTPSGGGHFLFMCGANPPANKNHFRPGIDIRSDGYYILLTPSIHPNGGTYMWRDGQGPDALKAAPYPDDLRPENGKEASSSRSPQWEQPAAKSQLDSATAVPEPSLVVVGPGHQDHACVVKRAMGYLDKVPPAVQGQGGHDSLLWAASCLVRGFCLDDSTALKILTDQYNPRCNPPWDLSDQKDYNDFSRKIREARKANFGKPEGWLLEDGKLSESVNGQQSARNLMAEYEHKQAQDEEESRLQPDVLDRVDANSGWEPYPVEVFADAVHEVIDVVASSNSVDPSFPGLSALVVSAAAIGMSRKLRLKAGFEVPAILWGAVVAPSGSNKSSPMRQIVTPVQEMELRDHAEYKKKLQAFEEKQAELPPNPLERRLAGDTTAEAMAVLQEHSKRGILKFMDELASHFTGFNQYKKGGTDREFYLTSWNGDPFGIDRKTGDQRRIMIQQLAISILGGIQPGILKRLLTEELHESGMTGRFLFVMPPPRKREWNEQGVPPELMDQWKGILESLYGLEFVMKALPETVFLRDDANRVFRDFFDEVAGLLHQLTDEHERALVAKYDVMAARMALVLHYLRHVTGEADGRRPLELDGASMRAGVTLGRWHMNESRRIYHLQKVEEANAELLHLLNWINTSKTKGRELGTAKARDLQLSNSRKYPNADAARKALDTLVQAGLAVWHEDEVVTLEKVKSA